MIMNFDRRTLLKSGGGSLSILPIAGCLSNQSENIPPSEKLGETETTKDGNIITLIQNVSSDARDLQLNLKYRSTVSGETGIVNTNAELTKSDSQYKKDVDTRDIFEYIPEDEPVELFAEAKLKDYTTHSDVVETNSYYGGTYHMLKYETDSMNQIDTDKAVRLTQIYDDGLNNIDINKIDIWESEGMIHYKIVFFAHIYQFNKYLNRDHGGKDDGEVIPFFFDLKVPKNEKEVLQQVAETKQITWRDFHKEVSTEIGDVTYYERDIAKEFADQIEKQINHYRTNGFENIYDITLLLLIWEKLIDYDYGTIQEDEWHLKYLSQILYDKEAICQGTTFGIASILHNLGYDVGMQVIVNKSEWEYPNGYHMEPTVKLENEAFEDPSSEPDKILDGLPEDELENQAVVYPRKKIGENPKRRLTTNKAEKITVNRVRMEYLEADS